MPKAVDPRRDAGTIVVLASAVFVGAGAAFSWLMVPRMSTVAGISGFGVQAASPIANGYVTGACAVGATVLAVFGPRTAGPTFVLGNLGALVAFIAGWFILGTGFALQRSAEAVVSTTTVTVGVGPYITFLGGIGILAGSLLRYGTAESSGSADEIHEPTVAGSDRG